MSPTQRPRACRVCAKPAVALWSATPREPFIIHSWTCMEHALASCCPNRKLWYVRLIEWAV